VYHELEYVLAVLLVGSLAEAQFAAMKASREPDPEVFLAKMRFAMKRAAAGR
jgi:hypothetical protein